MTWPDAWLALLAREWPALPVGLILWAGASRISRPPFVVVSDRERCLILTAFMLRLGAGLVLLLVFSGLVRGGDSELYYRSTALLAHQFGINFQKGLLLWWYGWPDFASNPASDIAIEYPVGTVLYCNETAYWADSEAFTIVRILTLLWMPAGGSIAALTLLSASFASIGIWLLYREFSRTFPQVQFEAACVLFLLPGVVIWSSGLLKEPWAFGAQSAAVGLWLHGLRKHRLSPFFLLVIPLILLALIRPPVFYLLISIGLCAAFGQLFNRNRLLGAGMLLVLIAVGVFASNFLSDLIQSVLIELEYYRWYALHYYGHSNSISLDETSAFDIGPPVTGWYEALRWVKAIGSALFHPLPWQVRRWIELPLAVENLVILFWLIYSLMCLEYRTLKDALLRHPWLGLLIGFAVVWLLISGLSTPFAGSLWRYRIHAVPFLLIGLAALWRNYHPLQKLRRSAARGFVE